MTRKAALHLDEARSQLVADLRADWSSLGVRQVLVIEDAFGRFALGVWGDRLDGAKLDEILKRIAPYDAAVFCADDDFDVMDLNPSWDEAVPVDEDDPDTIRRIVRHRMLPAWQSVRPAPLWSAAEGCPLVTFYSFKGGMGRTTTLAAFALDRVRRDEHVVVIDLDLDAPGLGSVFGGEAQSPYGVVDYLIERPILGEHHSDLLDHSSLVDLKTVRSSGSLRVFPAGRLDEHYLGKMARLDFEPPPAGLRHPLEDLLLQIRDKWKPDWILLDSRTGFSETAGMLLSGLAHFHVLVGVDSEQSWQGLGYAVGKLGAERVRRGFPQAEVLLVQGLVPVLKREQRDALLEGFQERASDLFQGQYFVANDDERDDDYWYLDDAGGTDSPDRAQSLSYAAELAQSVTIPDLIDVLDVPSAGYGAFCEDLARRAIIGGGT
jgi:hypothetical protein